MNNDRRLVTSRHRSRRSKIKAPSRVGVLIASAVKTLESAGHTKLQRTLPGVLPRRSARVGPVRPGGRPTDGRSRPAPEPDRQGNRTEGEPTRW